MNTRLIFSGAAAIVCAGALSAAQVAPQGGAQQTAPKPSPSSAQTQPRTAEPVTTLSGCLYRERDIPGRSPNVAEKAGIGEDYILADATTAGASGAAGAAQKDRSAAATAGLATGRMYEVTELDDERLRDLVGKRVEVTGVVKVDDARDTTTTPRGGAAAENRGRDVELPEIEATSIREVAGATCPATPAAAPPSDPGAGKPANPGAGNPANPGAGNPANPGAGDPNNPGR